jgi:hypothetical protein
MNQYEIILYKTEDGAVKIDTIFQNETIWLKQKKMAELFDVQRPAITKHLKNIFESGGLDDQVVVSILENRLRTSMCSGRRGARLRNEDKNRRGALPIAQQRLYGSASLHPNFCSTAFRKNFI